MYFFHNIDVWSEKHHPLWLDLFRVLLGTVLVWQAVYFIINKDAIVQIVDQYGFGFYTMSAAHGIIGIHLVGGVLIFFGLLTRLAAAIQIPVLFCNIVFIVFPNGFMSLRSEAELTIIVTALVLLFIFEGSGHYSVDSYLKNHER